MAADRLSFGPFVLDRDDESLWRDGERLALPPKAFAVLCHLVLRAGRLVTKDELLDAVWPDAHVADGVLKVRIRELRATLGDDPVHPRFVATEHRRGYRFVAEVGGAEAPAGGAARAGGGPSASPAVEPAAAPLVASAAAPPAALIGRDAELALLRRHLARSSAGERQIAFVSGEAGIGKTALADAFAAALPADVRVARGQCLEHHGSGEAYLPVLDALAQLTRGARGAAIVELLRRLAPTWLTQLPWLLSPADREILQRELAGTTRERMQREMAEAVEAIAADAPLVLILEDLHWSDPSTVDLLSLLAHRRAPARLLLLATYRPVDVILSDHPLKQLRLRLEQQRLSTDIALPFLAPEDVARFVERRLGAAPVPRDLAEAIHERTAGNPLFVVSLLEHLVALGWLAVGADGAFVLATSIAAIRAEIPEGVRQMIDQEIARLPAPEVAILEVAAVVGEEFDTRAVAAALGESVADVEAACEVQVRRSRILRALGVVDVGGALGSRYAFGHALQRDVLYRRVPRVRRLELHRSIGEWLERTGAGAGEIARHFLEAAQPGFAEKAIAASVRAAERSRSLLAFAEAARHYENALGALGEGEAARERRAEILIELGQTRERSGAVRGAREALFAAADHARAAGAPLLFARAAVELGRSHQLVSQVDEPLVAVLEEALAMLPRGAAGERACLLARLDAALSPLPGSWSRRDLMTREAIALARRLADDDVWLRVLQYARWGFIGRETPRELRAMAAKLEEMAARATRVEHALAFRMLRIAHLNELGEVEKSAAALDGFQRQAEDAAIPWFGWFAIRLRAIQAAQAGRFDEAEALSEEGAEFGKRTDHPNVRPLFVAQRASWLFLRGRFADLVRRFEKRVENPTEPVQTRAELAYLHHALGDFDAAHRQLEILAEGDFGVIPRDALWLMCLARLAEVAAGLGDRRRAAVLLRLFAPYADRVIGVGASIAPLGHGRRYTGLLAATLGKDAEAKRDLDTALRAHERMGSRPWIATTLLDRARWLAGGFAGRGEGARRRRGISARDRAAALQARDRALAVAREIGMEGVERAALALGVR